jgi:hypothetical protein
LSKLFVALVPLAALVVAANASAAGWTSSVPFTNQVASSPVSGAGYPAADGSPEPGQCGPGQMNSNRSESWLAVQPGTENLVGTSKFFFDKYSTFYNFYLGSYSIPNGKVGQNTFLKGYDCISTGTQDMPPSWTNNTDPNVDFDTYGRAYQITLPFNAYWTNLHPNGAISGDYSDDLGRTWTHSLGSDKYGYIEFLNNQTSFSLGGFEDKQWIAVNHFATSKYRDHAYAMWAIFNGQGIKLREAVSRDRGVSYSLPTTISMPSEVGPSSFAVYPSVDAAGDLYVALAAYRTKTGGTDATIYVTRSTDDGSTFTPWTKVAFAHGVPGDTNFPNGTFRDGILESFAASPTYPGHAYVTYEDYNSATGTMDVKLAYTTDRALTFTSLGTVNDAETVNDGTDQFQPSVAAGPNGAVAVAFYDRRAACPSSGASIVQAGKSNACIDLSVQAYKDNGTTLTPVLSNVRASKYAWDPAEPAQKVDGIGQIACYAHRDPCPGVFIGDYFGLAISNGNLYTLSVSTHYPSSVTADGGGPVYYQQQILATLPRSGFGAGY